MKTTIKLIALCCCLFAATSSISAQNKTEKLVRYHGMVDIGSGFMRVGSGVFTNTALFNLTTTHGVDITPYFFAGAGTGVVVDKITAIPLYARFRGNLALPNWRFYPFIETDLGAEFRTGNQRGLGSTGFAYNIALGGKFRWKKGGKSGVAFTMGYGETKRVQGYTYPDGLGFSSGYSIMNSPRWTFKFSFDF